MLFYIFGIACILYYIPAAGWISGFHTSGLWVWPAAAVLFIGAGAYFRWASRRWKGRRKPLHVRLAAGALGAWLLLFAVFEVGVLWGMGKTDVPEDAGTFLILGGGVVVDEPSPALRQRIETAARCLEARPDSMAIAAGGTGEDDLISEAGCIRRELALLGIEEERIWLEERSSTTAENMRFSYELYGDRTGKITVVTSNFHVFRSMWMARSAGFQEVDGVGAPFGGWMLPHYMVREFMTFVVDLWRGNLKIGAVPL